MELDSESRVGTRAATVAVTRQSLRRSAPGQGTAPGPQGRPGPDPGAEAAQPAEGRPVSRRPTKDDKNRQPRLGVPRRGPCESGSDSELRPAGVGRAANCHDAAHTVRLSALKPEVTGLNPASEAPTGATKPADVKPPVSHWPACWRALRALVRLVARPTVLT